MNKFVKISLRLVMGILVATAIACSRSADATVEHFYRSLAKGEVKEANKMVSKELIGMAGEGKIQMALSREAQRIQELGGIASIEVNLEGSGEVRSGKVKITYVRGTAPKIEKVKVVKEDGDWKIAADK